MISYRRQILFWAVVLAAAVLFAVWLPGTAPANHAADGSGGDWRLPPGALDFRLSALGMLWIVSAPADSACSAFYNKVKRQCSGNPDCPAQLSSAESLCLLSAPLFVRPARLLFPPSAFGRPAAPAFSLRAAQHQRLLLPRNRRHSRHVPPEPLLPDTAHPGVPPRQAAGCLRGYAARRRASRCAAGGLCLPCGQACLPVSVWVLPYHQSPPSQIGNQLFEFSSKVFQMVVKILLYLIDIDKTVPKSRYRSHRLRPCQGNRPADRGQQTRLRAII